MKPIKPSFKDKMSLLFTSGKISKKRRAGSAMQAKDFPPDLITDILSRLSLKTLVRFRCVSKPWLDLITHSRFPYRLNNRHLDCDPFQDCNHNPQTGVIVPCYKLNENGELETGLRFVGGGYQGEDAFKSVEIDFPLIKGKSFKFKTSCCDGMICLSVKDGDNSRDNILVLWNPSIRDYKILPLPVDSRVCKGVCGLGFDFSMDDYKIVSVTEDQIHVFSVKRNLWRTHEEFKYFLFNKGISANGNLYWVAGKKNNFADRILCLNLSDDTYREVSLPPFAHVHRWVEEEGEFVQVPPELSLLLFGGSVCLYCRQDQSLWKMKEMTTGIGNSGGVRENWTRLMILPRIPNPDMGQVVVFASFYHLLPKCFLKGGKVLVSVRGRKFVVYDPELKNYEDLHVHDIGDVVYHKAVVYTESLISPNSIRSMNDID